MTTTTQLIESQSSFEFGPAKKRFKIYYWDAEDLNKKLQSIKAVINEQTWIDKMEVPK